MENTKEDVIYRPVDCRFLDKCGPQLFWCSRKSAERDFPDIKIKQYSLNEFNKYLEEKKLEVKNVTFYN